MTFIAPYKERLKTRGETFEKLFEIARDRNISTIVETGCIRKPSIEGKDVEWRGDGGSTILFAEYAKKRGAYFWSCDICLDTLNYCKEICDKRDLPVCFVENDSVDFLKNFGCHIDILYLDSFNYDPSDPMPAMSHCLKEIQAVEDKLHYESIIAIDDLFGHPTKNPSGKPGFAIRYLLQRGWKIVAWGRQIVFTKYHGDA